MEHGLYEFSAVLRLASAALIGCGVSEMTDIDVIRDVDGVPYIPASAIAGVLRHLTAELMDEPIHTSIWGTLGSKISGQADSRQSAVTLHDLVPCDAKKITTQIRDAIRLDPKTGLVADTAKFDHEVIEHGADFIFRMQVRYSASVPQVEAAGFLACIHALLVSSEVHVGARTTNGLGRLEYSNSGQPVISHYATGTSPRDRLDWLLRKPRPLPNQEMQSIMDMASERTRSGKVRISARFKVRRSMIVRSYPGDPEMPDAVQFKSGSDYIIPGSSLKGAIRARATRIARHLSHDDTVAARYIDRLFGTIEGAKDGKARRGRIRVQEILLDGLAPELQTRIKTDRFTGGTIEGALFDSMPLFVKKDDNGKMLQITMDIEKAGDDDIGLMLLVLKDLWTGMVALGGEKNVGRGALEGIGAEIRFGDGTHVCFDKDTLALELVRLQPKVDSLVKALQEVPV